MRAVSLRIVGSGFCPICAWTSTRYACPGREHREMKESNLKLIFVYVKEQVRAVARSSDFNIAVRNPVYFSNISDEIAEEYMSNIYPEKALGKYDAFFGEDDAYIQFKKSVIK